MTHTPIHPLEHAGKMLSTIAFYGWLRPQELGLLRYGAAAHSRKYAEAGCRKLLAAGMVLARQLPRHSGTAFVLSQQGAALVNYWDDAAYRSGKDFGDTKSGAWSPPASWQHDLAAIGLLAHLRALGWIVRPEIALRREAQLVPKHPDGLVYGDGQGYWLEVEAARKSGPNMVRLVESLVRAARGQPVTYYDAWQHLSIKRAMVAIERTATDERGYALNHWQRIETAIRKRGLIAPVEITVAWLTMRGEGVGSIDLEIKHVIPSKTVQK